MRNLHILKMDSIHIDEVMEVEKKSFSTPWSREAFEKEVRENQLALYFVAELEGSVVGYCGLWLIMDEAHITNIAVDPDYRGLKIGDALVKKILEKSREKGLKKVTLEVRESNEVAQGLYEKHGFESCGIRARYYHDNNENAVIMWKEL